MKYLNKYETLYITNNKEKTNFWNRNLIDFHNFIKENTNIIDLKKYIILLWKKINKYIQNDNKKLQKWNENKKIIFKFIWKKEIINIKEDIIYNKKEIKNCNLFIEIILHKNYRYNHYDKIIFWINKNNILKITKIYKEIWKFYKKYNDLIKIWKKLEKIWKIYWIFIKNSYFNYIYENWKITFIKNNK